MEEFNRSLKVFDDIRSTPEAFALSFVVPAFDVNRFLAAGMATMESSNLSAKYADVVGKATSEWQALFKAVDFARLRIQLPVETHFAKLYKISAIAEASLFLRLLVELHHRRISPASQASRGASKSSHQMRATCS